MPLPPTSKNYTSSAIQGISYAKLANLPPVIGLYSSFMPPLIYSVLGSSGDLAVGPISISSLVMGSMLREVISPEKEPIIYIQLAFTATFIAGVFQASLGLLSGDRVITTAERIVWDYSFYQQDGIYSYHAINFQAQKMSGLGKLWSWDFHFLPFY